MNATLDRRMPEESLTSHHASPGTRILLGGGVLSSLLYLVMNIAGAMQWPEYQSFSQTISELSALNAPTRAFWVPLAWLDTLLVAGFGWGLVRLHRQRSLEIAGVVVLVYGLLGFVWTMAPMHQRADLAAGAESLTDTMHLTLAAVSIALMFAAIGFTARSFGFAFRVYSLATVLVQLFFGLLTARAAPLVQADAPTPWLGVWERISVGAFLLWVVVVALLLLRPPSTSTRGG